MFSNKKESSYLCRCITAGGLLKIVPAGFFKKKTIYYFYPSKISSFFERYGFLVPFFSGRIIIRQVDYNIDEMYTSDSKPLIDLVYYDVLYRIIDGVDANILRSKYSLLNFLNSKLYKVKDDLILYIKHRITMNILDDLLMVEVSNWLANNSKSKLFGCDLTLFLSKKSYWTDLVFRYAREKSVPFVYLNSLTLRGSEFVKITYC